MEPLSCWPPEDDTLQKTDISEHHITDMVPDCCVARDDTTRNSTQSGARKRAKHHANEDHEDFVNIALAKWWRSSSQIRSNVMTSGSSNPNTFLRKLSSHPDAEEFLKSEITRLKRIVEYGDPSAHTHAALASFLDKYGHLQDAIVNMEIAVIQDENNKEYTWIIQKLRKKLDIQESQDVYMKEFHASCDVKKSIPKSIPVEKISGKDLSFSHFFMEYATKGVPIIITDVVPMMTTLPWTFDHIQNVAGSCPVRVKKLVSGSVEWAQLEDAESITVSKYLGSLPSQIGVPVEEMRYLFDWGLPIHCPQLAEELTIPKYFATDFLQRTDQNALYHDSWPSLFIAPCGLRSELHVDAFGSNFWMALFQGSKRWIIYDREDLPCLYPNYESDHSTDPTFDVKLTDPDFERFPLLQRAVPRECVLMAGELLFVPAGSPHYVENLEQSIALSANYVDQSNIHLVKRELAVNGLIHDLAADLFEQISAANFNAEMDMNIEDMPWKTFKNQLRPSVPDMKPTNTAADKHDKYGAQDIFCYGPLLDMVQRSRIYPDSKSFVDRYMLSDPDTVMKDFQDLVRHGHPTRDQLKAFLDSHFGDYGQELEKYIPPDWSPSPKLLEHIKNPLLKIFAKDLNELWKTLGRKMNNLEHPERHTLIQVPKPFIIPGDRFIEFYYWDTYWIIGGLLAVDMIDTVRGILENFIHMVEKYGFVPNGGRIYYLNRSQPPLFIPMVDLYLQHTNDTGFITDNIATLEKEYHFWLEHRSLKITSRSGREHTIARYNVKLTNPRPEGYTSDVKVVQDLAEPKRSEVLSDIASACESGWDFSSRWFADKTTLASIKTSQIIPVDLNVYLCWCEQLLAKFHGLLGNKEKQETYHEYANKRKCAIDDLFWNDDLGAWFDLDLESMTLRTEFYASNLFPLMCDCTNLDFKEITRAKKVLEYLKDTKVLDFPGGIPTSLTNSGQQWDFPNAWSPLVHFLLESISKLAIPEAKEIAKTAAYSWVTSNMAAWKKYGHMYEKYNVEKFGYYGGGGEYHVQIGFGWTNGVILMLLDKYGATF